ncbi:BCL2 modifying factor 2 [Rhinichthys klamathensis goyatoka]|uniref:BCL2 modifying factor 2 n=1 Tax=Rhinichthys klamathensis goyatoka TaxID=3034132 RepID=UPI0024B6246F|nr:BCL2 modifying factor 2 [Rhinichthys klamathensis goyatoka]
MDDEEEEQLPRCCETPLRVKSSENGDAHRRAVNRHRLFEDRSTQTVSSVLNSVRVGDMAPFQGSGRDTSSPCGAVDARTAFRAHCGSRGLASLTMAPGAPGPRALFHGNAGFRAHFPALFEPVPDGVQNVEEREADEARPEEKEDERDMGISVEIQIGRKLREMGDQFQQEHLQLFTHRGQLGLFQLVTSIYNFLFPQEGAQNARARR